MWIKAQVVLSNNKEIETKKGIKYRTELFMIDADNKQSLYVGRMYGERPRTFPEDEVITFQVAGVYSMGKKTFLSLKPDDLH